MRNSKNMLIIISEDTNWDRGLLNYEIEKAVDYYKIPIIVAYTGEGYILNPSLQEDKWPKALYERIKNNTAKCIHISFKEKMIMSAISQFSVNGEQLKGPLHYYTQETYEKWGLL